MVARHIRHSDKFDSTVLKSKVGLLYTLRFLSKVVNTVHRQFISYLITHGDHLYRVYYYALMRLETITQHERLTILLENKYGFCFRKSVML